jgi:hypothetical protein
LLLVHTSGHEVTGLKTYRGPKRKEQFGVCSLPGYMCGEQEEDEEEIGRQSIVVVGSHLMDLVGRMLGVRQREAPLHRSCATSTLPRLHSDITKSKSVLRFASTAAPAASNLAAMISHR